MGEAPLPSKSQQINRVLETNSIYFNHKIDGYKIVHMDIMEQSHLKELFRTFIILL